MESRARALTRVWRLGIGATIGSVAGLVWFIGWARRDLGRPRARAPLWPRPDGSTRSYGEVWDITTATWPPADG